MRFMVIVKASKDSEAGRLPDAEHWAAMGRFNEELIKAGVMLAADGLHPSAKGARVRFSGKEPAVIDGPFAETKELVAGYWLWQVRSREEAIAWLKRAPFGGGVEVELRQVRERHEFDPALTGQSRQDAPTAGAHSERPAATKLQPYLDFEGRSEEAIDYYCKALGAEVQTLLRFGEAPQGACETLPPDSQNKVAHCELRIGDTTLMASDCFCAGEPKFEGVSMSLTAPDDAAAKRLFDALADGGTVRQPLTQTFFATSFGMVTDRFGLPWMVAARR